MRKPSPRQPDLWRQTRSDRPGDLQVVAHQGRLADEFWKPPPSGFPQSAENPWASSGSNRRKYVRPEPLVTNCQAWPVSTAILSAENTFYFLDACNRNPDAEDRDTQLAPSTRFWGAALRFVAGLALRDRFLPSMTVEGESFHARWKPLIAAPDQDRLRILARAMPPVARAITPQGAKTPPEDDPAALLSGFVGWMMDVLPRAASSSTRLPASLLLRNVNKHNIDAAWMIRLRTIESEMPGSRELLSSFFDRVNAWQRPVVREAEFPWFLSFELHEPDDAPDDA